MINPLFAGVGLAVLLGAASAAFDPYLTGDPAAYPKPAPVETVPRGEGVPRHASLARVPADARPLAGAANRAVQLDVLQVIRTGEIAGEPVPDGMEAVTLVTRWTHVLPRQKVERAALEGRADRTMGAGGLFGGGRASTDLVEVDVAYQIPAPSEHLYLAVDGVAEAMQPAGAALPDGLALHEPFTLARLGDARIKRVAFLVPAGSRHLALHFFDNAQGAITVSVSGDANTALNAEPAGVLDRARVGSLDLAARGTRFASEYAGTEAPEGWRFALVELLGRNTASGADNYVRIDPTRFVWLAGDAGALWYGLPPADGASALSFTPGIFQRREAAFLVPAALERFRLGLRERGGAASLAVTAAAPEPMPPGAIEQRDSDSLSVAVFGARWEGTHYVLDLGLRPAGGGSAGIEIDPAQQFLLVAGGQELRPDSAMSQRLSRRAPQPLVVPPGTPLRFELAYALPPAAAPEALRYRGLESEARLALDAVAPAGVRGQPTADGLTEFPVFARPKPPAPEPVVAGGTAEPARPVPGAAPVTPRVVELPPYDPSRAGEDQEPNDNFERAQPLGPDLSIRGTLTPGNPDYFYFDIDEPGVWVFEARGAGVAKVAYVDATRWPQSERAMEPDSDTLWLDNLYLAPGRHWVALNGTQAGGDYDFRAVRLAAPSPADEREPNNDATRADVLRIGEHRTGLIAHSQDRDFFRFLLDVPSHVELRLAQPPETRLQLRVDGGPRSLLLGMVAEPGEPIVYRAMLGAGEYQLQVASNGGSRSRAPYRLSLDLLDPFDRPVDLEPNDTAGAASPIGTAHRFDGQVGDTSDTDWLQLPVLPDDRTLELHLTSPGNHATASLKRVDGKATRWETFNEDSKRRTADGRVYQGALAAGETYLLNVSGKGSYQVELVYSPDGPTVSDGPAPVLSTPESLPRFAAFRDETQAVEVPVELENPGSAPRNLQLEGSVSAAGWSVDLPPQPVRLGPGEARTVRVPLRARADLPATASAALFLRAVADDGAASASGTVPLAAACGVPAVAPAAHRPVPHAMRGGLNLAWTALGAEPVPNNSSVALLFDGQVALRGEWRQSANSLPVDLSVRLAGSGSRRMAGVAITPSGGNQERLGPFAVLVSDDGESFREVLRGELRADAVEQYFPFDQPVDASVVTVRLEAANPVEPVGHVELREIKVVAAPDTRPLGDALLNLAAPELGGHVVRALPQPGDYRSLQGMLSETEERPTLAQRDPQSPLEFVLGFRDNRAARIVALEWREQGEGTSGKRIENMEVWASLESPLGPWQPLGLWRLGLPAGATARLDFEAPAWARYLRLHQPATSERVTWLLPETLRVLEQPAGDDYQSAIGEWGLYAQAAGYEEQDDGASPAPAGTDAGDDQANALTLESGRLHTDSVSIGNDEDHYRIVVPDGDNQLELVLGGRDPQRVEVRLADAGGAAVPMQEDRREDGSRVLRATVVGGAHYYLKVAEPPRSIMVAWDNSGSVGSYRPAIYRSLEQFFDDIQPGSELVNLMPFRDRDVRTLVPDWTDDPRVLSRALNDYDRSDGSSNAEATIVGALQKLEQRPGNRAIVLITDAASNGFDRSEEVWRGLERLRASLFTLELHLQERNVDHYQDLMQDWAAANRGHYAYFRSQADLDQAFARAACLMRRPAEYSLALDVGYRKPPEPGELVVQWEPGKAAAGASVELILDASGSMRSSRQLIDGRLKMDVAKDVLRGVVADLPDDVQVGLRAYGHRIREGQPGDCTDSELMVKIEPLDRPRLLSRIDALQALGTTAISYSLREAAKDFAGIDGPKLIVLVTDGEEECSADPAATIAELRAEGLDVRLNVAGFALADDDLKQAMQTMASAGGGAFFDARDGRGLADAVNAALAVPVDLVDEQGTVVASGAAGGDALKAPPGRYTLRVHTVSGEVSIPGVEIREAQSQKLTLRREGDGLRHTLAP